MSISAPTPQSTSVLSDHNSPQDESIQLSRLEDLADAFYNSQDQGARRQAHIALLPFTNSADCIPQCQFIIDHSRKPYALLLAASSLLRLLTQFWNAFSVDQTVEMRNYLLNYLAS
ncbi:hypothetical protein BVRB_021780, partial [Beta vulgaris subsp. vulgaris]